MKVAYFPLVIERDWPWIRQNLPVVLMENTKGIIAVNLDNDEPIAAVVFDNWSASAVQCHIYIGNAMVLRHGFLQEIYEYIFDTCNKEVMIGLVPADFDWALKFDKKIGFKETHRIKDGYDIGIDYVILEMRREDAERWKKVKHG